LRYAPYATSRSLIWIPPGTSSVSDEGGFEPNEAERTTWQRVGYAGFVGWVNARFLKSNRPPPDPSSPPAPELASGTGLSVLHWLRCFGNGPSWSMEFGADGKAKCEGSCRGSVGLRAANVSVTYSGILQAFDLIDPQDELLLHATTRATASCRVGKSKDAHYYEFKATGESGPLEGCCRNAGFDRGSAIGHLRRHH
jgi:uncharacterized membrane protein